jgi:hypothetical protein
MSEEVSTAARVAANLASNVLINIKYKMLNNEKLSVYGEVFYQKNILFEVPFSFLLDSVF